MPKNYVSKNAEGVLYHFGVHLSRVITYKSNYDARAKPSRLGSLWPKRSPSKSYRQLP